MTPSERRLHPASFLFAITGQLRNFLLPGIAVIFTAGAAGADWDMWLMTVVIPLALFSLVRSLSYRYRLDESELVIRTGFIFRNERHIPYARIQNVESVQNVIHRLADVVEVRIETGATDEAEATMQVVPVAAYHEIRERVSAHRAAILPEAPAAETGTVLLTLPARELLLSGLIANRSAVVIAAAFGIVWELGAFDFVFDWIFGDTVSARGAIRQVFRAFVGLGTPSPWYLLIAAGTAIALLTFVTLISMTWAYVRLYRFTLRRVGDDLLAEYGLLTRVATTIPLRRIQTLTVFEGPLYQMFGRASVRVETAGGETMEEVKQKEPLVPIIPRADLDAFLVKVLPDIDLQAAEWQPPAPRAFRRELRQCTLASAAISVLFVLMLKVWTLAVLAGLFLLSIIHARRYVASLGWALVEHAVLFRRGWAWRRLTAARFSKIQSVALHESPFDRRNDMARVQVDTAGASDHSDAVDIPYVQSGVARGLHARLAGEASRRSFEW